VGEDSEEQLAAAGRVGPCRERGSQTPLVPGEDALDLPALPVATTREATEEATTVAPAGRASGCVAGVDRDGREGDPEVLAAEAVVVLAVEGGVGQHPSQRDTACSLPHDGRELGRVVGRAEGDRGTGDQVGGVVAEHGQLRIPQAPEGALAAAAHEVGADVARLEAGGVHGPVAGSVDQAACAGSGEDDIQEAIERPPFRSRCSA